MVFCGRPSKSCEACRKTKTKCDRIHPACGQCVRTGRVCPGYRDLELLLFRDETTQVIKRAQQPLPRKVVHHTSAAKKHLNGVQSISLLPNRRDQAICLFFYEYAADVNGVYDYVPGVCSRASISTDIGFLYNTIELIGLGHLSSMRYGSPCCSDTELEVYKKHGSVLKAVNSALCDPSLVTKDETLVTIMLLGLFETVTCMKPKSLYTWTNHINGAAALIKARGQTQFETEIGRQIFYHLLGYIALSAMQRRQLIPQDIIDIAMSPCAAQTPREMADLSLFQITTEIARARYMSARQSVHPEAILSLTKTIDESLERWAASMPDEYAFSTVPALPSQKTLNGVYHRYTDRRIARLWNGYRMGSIINATNMVLQAALVKTPEAREDLATALCRQQQMSAELCNSVPYYELLTPLTSIVAHNIIWPLYCVATASNVLPRARTWAVQRMRQISIYTATMQGVQIADTLARQPEVTVWEREGEVEEESTEW